MIKIRVVMGERVVKILIVIHLGINPVSGGSPLNESRRSGIIN